MAAGLRPFWLGQAAQRACQKEMRIFFICQRVPFPPDRGDKITTFHEIRHLARRHDVHVFCLADGYRDLENVQSVLAHARTVTAVPVGRLRSKLRMVSSLLSNDPISVAAFNERKLHVLIKEKFYELRPELLIVYSGNVAQFADHFAGAARIIQFADLDSLKWRTYAECTQAPLKWLYKLEARRLLRYERRIATSFSHSLVCTANERSDFKRLIPEAALSLVGNGVDLEHFRPTERQKEPKSIIFTGVMDYFPNVDAVLWFCEEVLPIVRSRVPEAKLTICGSNPVTSVRRLGRRQGVTVTGRVPDIRANLSASEIAVVPVRIARGIQNKILEALAMGLPVVSSMTAWRGTVIPQGDGILAADEPGEFAAYVVRLLTDPAYRSEMSKRGRAAVEENYTWALQLAKLDRVISAVTKSG